NLQVKLADRKVRIRVNDGGTSSTISSATITVWGETFTHVGNGEYESPFLPADEVATITVNVAGRTEVQVPAQFVSTTPPVLETAVPPAGSTNTPPTVTLAASSLVVNNGVSVTFTATAKDPENSVMTYHWESSSGSLSTSTSGLQATWTAPSSGTGSATITFKATDAGSLFARTTLTVGYMPIANQKPTVDFSIDPNVSTLSPGVLYTLTANATDPDGNIFAAAYLWSVTLGTLSTTTEKITNWTTPSVADTTPVTLSLKVTDEAGDSTTKTQVFSIVPLPATPSAQISKPAANAIFPPGNVLFSGSVKLTNGGTLPVDYYQWNLMHQGSSFQYAIASTSYFTYPLTATGSYLVTLTATSPEGLATSTSIAFKINAPPEGLSITRTPSQTTYPASTSISFEGFASDPDGQTLSYAWKDYSHVRNATSTLPSGKQISFEDFVPGSHTITLQVSDSQTMDGVPYPASATTSVTFGIATNTEPSPIITSPAAETKWYFVNTPVPFAGYATDAETIGGYVASESQSWVITEPNGSTKTSAATTSFTLTFVSPGTYTITLTASDTLKAENSVQRSLYINATPTVALEADPEDGTRFSRGQEFTLTANVGGSGTNDDLQIEWWDHFESANLQLDSLEMTSSTDSFTYATTTSGLHQIEARVIDSCGIATSVTRSFLINDLPVPQIAINFPQYAVAPNGLPILLATGSPIYFAASATDFESGVLSSSHVEANLKSDIVTGVPINATYSSSELSSFEFNLDPGRYTLTVTATDGHASVNATSSTFVVWRAKAPTLTPSLNLPSSLFLDGSSCYISDTGNSVLRKYSSDFTTLQKSIGGAGGDPGSFTSLVGVTKSGTKFYTLESSAPAAPTFARIQVWNNSLATESHFGGFGTTGPASYSYPTAITAANNFLYISDTGAHRIKMLSLTDGTALTTLPSTGTTPGTFDTPLGIRSIGSTIYVADWKKNQIAPLSESLTPYTRWPASNPSDITQFSDNYFATCDLDGGRIQFFTNNGTWQLNAGTTGTALGSFTTPVSIVKSANNLIILERSINRVQILSLPDATNPW
nr:NHL repeat-containing protein [Candidatus Ozemobacteraceae bacterium]